MLSSTLLDHLTPENKRLTLAEAFRVLRPDGGLHIADFRKSNELLTAVIREAGFEQVEDYAEYRTLFGRLALWQAQRP